MLAPRVVNAMEDDLRVQIRDLVAAFAGNGECDVVRDVARLYPTQVFLTLFGLPLTDRDQLVEWVETVNENSTTGTGEPNPAVVEAAMAMFGYLQGCVDEKRDHRGDDMLSRVLALQGDDAWSNDEVIGLTWLVTLAGLDTVTAAIGFTMLHLAQSPELRGRMVADPSLAAPVIEEMLRLEPPAPTTPRVTTQDVEVCGVQIPAGSPVALCLATANREAGRYEHPDSIDLAQADRGHVTFGGGIHRCLGSHLARQEVRLVVEEFHALIPEYEIAPGFEPEVVWPSSTLHLASLPLVFPAAGGAS
jgi:cytochrome P450